MSLKPLTCYLYVLEKAREDEVCTIVNNECSHAKSVRLDVQSSTNAGNAPSWVVKCKEDLMS